MKKLAALIAGIMLLATGSMAYAGQFGPPEPAAKEGKVALGIGYFYYSAKFKSNDNDWGEDTATQNQAYLQLGYGIAKNWEAYLRVGGADATSKGLFDFDNSTSDFKDGYKPFGTIGVKGVFNVSDSFGMGPFFQASLYSSYKDQKTGIVDGDTWEVTAKFKNPREINLIIPCSLLQGIIKLKKARLNDLAFLLFDGGHMRQIIISFILISFLSACGGQDVYKDVFNKNGGPNVRTFSASVDTCYLAVKKAILTQNFRIEKEEFQAKSFTAARYFEDSKDSTVLTINANVIAAGSDKATIYISAVQHMEKVRTKTDRTFFGLIPVGSEATKVKQEERTVEDEDFYKKFFEAVEKEIKI